MTGIELLLTALAVIAAVWVVLVRRRDGQRLRSAEARTVQAREQTRVAAERLNIIVSEMRHLAAHRIPAAVLAQSHPHAPVPGLRYPKSVATDAAGALRLVLDASLEAVSGERERVDAAARAAMRGTTAKVQSLLLQIQSLVQELQHEHDDPRLLELDFRNELALRRTQATAVLCEAWPGLARTDSPLAEIVIGAQSRVPGYARIKVANHLREPRLAVVARAAEPLAVALAELLANATAYSHPETEVPVTIQQTGGRGAFVLIDDAGIGMDEETLARARALLAPTGGVQLTELGNPPQAGFAVVGRLLRQYGMTCHIEPSPYGGMRAMLGVPDSLLTVVDEEHPLSVLVPEPAAPAPDPGARPLGPAATGTSPTGPAATAGTDAGADSGTGTARTDAAPSGTTGTGLPTRRRRGPRPGRPARSEPEAPAAPRRTPQEASDRWAALQRGTTSGRNAAAPPAPGGNATGKPPGGSQGPGGAGRRPVGESQEPAGNGSGNGSGASRSADADDKGVDAP